MTEAERLRWSKSMPASGQPLYLVTDGGPLRQRGTLVRTIEEMLQAAPGAVWAVQLREQVPGAEFAPAADEELLAIGCELQALCKAYRTRLIVNSRPDLAKAIDADGVHLGHRGPSVLSAREILGDQSLIGFSAHTMHEIQAAKEQGADYLFFSPVFAPISKQPPASLHGIDGLRQACRETNLPVFALGGITPENAQSCRQAGAAGIAGIGALLGAANPPAAARRFIAALTPKWER